MKCKNLTLTLRFTIKYGEKVLLLLYCGDDNKTGSSYLDRVVYKSTPIMNWFIIMPLTIIIPNYIGYSPNIIVECDNIHIGTVAFVHFINK